MLPEDTRQCKEAALDSSMQVQQTSISDHCNIFNDIIIPYCDRAFMAAAINWLVHTNQVDSFVSFLPLPTDNCVL